MIRSRMLPYIKVNADEPLPRDRFPCRACRKPTPMLRRRSYCTSCWAALPRHLKRLITANTYRPANRITSALAKNLYAQADRFLLSRSQSR